MTEIQEKRTCSEQHVSGSDRVPDSGGRSDSTLTTLTRLVCRLLQVPAAMVVAISGGIPEIVAVHGLADHGRINGPNFMAAMESGFISTDVVAPEKLPWLTNVPSLDGRRIPSRVVVRPLPPGGSPRGVLLALSDRKIGLGPVRRATLDDLADVISREPEIRAADPFPGGQVMPRLPRRDPSPLAGQMFDSCGEAILITDSRARIVYVNPAFCRVTGFDGAEVLGLNPSIMSSGRHDREFYRRMWDSLVSAGQWRGEIWDRRKNGEVYPKWLAMSAIRDETGHDIYYLGIFSDITFIKQAEQRLDRLAHHDALTGLPNLILFRDRLRQALAQAERERHTVALMFLDLDNFKEINDTWGHLAGDQLLIQVGARLRGCVRRSDTVARYSGDEFVIVLSIIDDEQDARIVADKVVDAFSTPFEIEGRPVPVTCSLGIALCPVDGSVPEALIRAADQAMYVAKGRGKNRYCFHAQCPDG